jgi:6-phosphogluconolactonase (cycloisomerase 2 family)
LATENTTGATSGNTAPFYASIGPVLTRYDANIATGTLTARQTLSFPLDIQYAWRHPNLPVFYVAISNGGPGKTGNQNQLVACRIDADSGDIAPFGQARDLRWRPLHLSLDRQNVHVLVAYNNPSAVTVHKIGDDGALGDEVPQSSDLDVGIFGHQVQVTPNGDAAILVCRGYDAEDGKVEQPGALKVYGYADGTLSPRASIEPNAGFGFGARHLDFHPTKPWLFLGVERQSELHVFALENGSVRPKSLHQISTLEGPNDGPARQAMSGIHIHPNGKVLYISNRAYGQLESSLGPAAPEGEDNIAVFAINQNTGQPTAIQHAPTHGHLPRTFSIDASGRMLVAANSEAAPKVSADGGERQAPLSLITYQIAGDGTLKETGMIKFQEEDQLLFWAGFL